MKKLLIILLALYPLMGNAQNKVFAINGKLWVFSGKAGVVPYPNNTLFSIIGQSNASGRAYISNLPSQYDIHYPKSYINLGSIDNLDITINNNRYPVAGSLSGRFGPEIGLAYTSNFTYNNYLSFCKYAWDGTSLPYSWNVNLADSMYTKFKAHYLNTKSRLGTSIQNDYVVWYQGEQDARFETNSDLYYDDLIELIDSINSFTDTVPFFLCRLHYNTRPSFAPYLDTIRSSQYFASIENPNVYMISTDSLSQQVDSLHLDYQGQLDLGETISNIIFSSDAIQDSLLSSHELLSDTTSDALGKITSISDLSLNNRNFIQADTNYSPIFQNDYFRFESDYVYYNNTIALDSNYTIQLTIRTENGGNVFTSMFSGANVLTGGASGAGFDMGYDLRSSSNQYIYIRNWTGNVKTSGLESAGTFTEFSSKDRTITIVCKEVENTTEFYVDDKLIGTDTYLDLSALTLNYIVLGGRTYFSQSLATLVNIKSLYIYNRALTHNEITHNYYRSQEKY